MAVPKIFVTGVTGYVGGDALAVIYEAHPTWEYRFLVRDAVRGEQVTAAFPSAALVLGDLSHLDLLTTEVAAADITLHFASSDDTPASRAIVAGLAQKSSKVFWIHTSGSANLLFDDMQAKRYGQAGQKLWDDITDVETITSFPDAVVHRPGDRIALEAGEGLPHVQTAVVCPPTIVGRGRGPSNQRSIQVPLLVELIRKRRRGFRVGPGLSSWSFIHVHDLSQLYLKLVEAAAAGGVGADWGPQAYYFAENGECAWGEVAQSIVAALKSIAPDSLDSNEVDELTADEARELAGLAPGSYGANSRSKASRARRSLGWEPRIADFEPAIRDAVEQEFVFAQGRLADFAQGHMPGGVK